MTEAARRDNGATLLAEEEGEEEAPGGANIEWGGIFVKEVLRGLKGREYAENCNQGVGRGRGARNNITGLNEATLGRF